MRIGRLALLLVALTISLIAAPDAFAKKKGGVLIPSPLADGAAGEWEIDCEFDGNSEDHCSGSLEYCLGYCHATCGGPCTEA